MSASLGHGIGLRTRHYPAFFESAPACDFVEVISENLFGDGGRPRALLDKVRRDMPVALHGVSLSIGGVDPLDEAYLGKLGALIARYEPAIVSDHLCWGRHGGRYVHDLWPLPCDEETLAHVVARVDAVQERLGRRILLENVSSYVSFARSTMSEWDFLAEVARRADCGILLDVNNIVVSAFNHDFDARDYLAGIPAERVGQIHLAGHQDRGTHLLDTHDAPVPDAVWQVYRAAVQRCGPVPTLVEWDEHVPTLEVLLGERDKAAAIERDVLRAAEMHDVVPRRPAAGRELAP